MSSDAGSQAFGFGTPFQAQIDYLRQKLNLPTERWDDITGRAQDRAFVVAGASKADLINDLHEQMNLRAQDGAGLQAFRKDFKAIAAKHGWTGWTGEDSPEGIAWRTRIIYQTNMATSYAAGRYQQMSAPEVLKLHPYWRYIHSDGVLNPRPMHLAWHGLTLLASDPFWQTHYPPNGFGCHCRITSVTRKEGEASARAGLGVPPEGWDTLNTATGEQQGIGKGFGYTPGASWHPNLDKYPADMARQVVAANLRDGVFERWVKKINDNVATELATGAYKGMDTHTLLGSLRAKMGEQGTMPLAILDAPTRELLGVDTQTLLISDYDLIKQAVSRNGDYDALKYMAVQDLIDGLPFVAQQANGRFLLVPDGRKVPLAVVHRTQDGSELYLKSYRAGYGPDEIARSKKKDAVLRDL
jgi:Phage Mu protein F like protein